MGTRWQQRVIESWAILSTDFQHCDGTEIVAFRRNDAKVGVVAHASNLGNREVEAEGSGVRGHLCSALSQPRLYESLSHKKGRKEGIPFGY